MSQNFSLTQIFNHTTIRIMAINSEGEIVSSGAIRPVKVVLAESTLGAMEQVKGQFGVETNVLKTAGQRYEYSGKGHPGGAEVPKGKVYVELKGPTNDLSDFWDKVHEVEASPKSGK